MKRIDKWKEEKSILTFLQGENKKNLDFVSDHQDSSNLNNIQIIASAKELIFDIKNDLPIFYIISYIFDTDNMSIKIAETLELSITGDNENEINDEVSQVLALASIEDIPVYPNEKKLESLLEKYHKNMLINGFSLETEKEKKQYKLTQSIEEHIENPEILDKLDYSKTYSPSDLLIIKSIISKEFSRLQNVRSLLGSLEIAIVKLENLLVSQKRNENDLQRCLTENPILFGADYAKLISKPKFGSEYELDYALQKYTGEYELVEIEASTHQLYTKNGNPSQHLVHAEQQVIDWLHWLEENHAYARKKLPEIISPIAYVIIGRYKDDDEKEKIKRRNSIYKGQIVILTYDDIILKAKNLLNNLQKLSQEKI